MRDASAELREVIAGGGYMRSWVADLIYDDERVVADVPLLRPSFSWDGGAQIQGSGSCDVVSDDLFGRGIVPRQIGDLFSPFGAELQVDMMIGLGVFAERVPMGRFVLESVPEGAEFEIPVRPTSPAITYGPWVEQRRNFATNPCQGVVNSHINFIRGTGSSGADYLRLTISDALAVQTAQRIESSGAALPSQPAAPGDVFTLSAEGRTTAPAAQMVVNLQFRDAANALVGGGSFVGLTTAVNSSTFSGLAAVTATAPAGTARVYWAVGLAGSGPRAIGDTMDVRNVLVEKTATAGSFFDGSATGPDLRHRYQWVGTAHASASVYETRTRDVQRMPGLPVTIASQLSLQLKDYFLRVQRDTFPFPKPPTSTSMWDEAIGLTGLAVVRNIADVTIPTSVTYDEDRLKALDDIFAVANAWPHLTSGGQLTARVKDWPAVVDEFRDVVSAPRVMESDKVYNRVVVEGKSAAGGVLRSIREVGEGFLRVRNPDGSRSPFGGATYEYQSDFLTTQAQCDATAAALLAQVSQLRSVTRTVVEPLMPLREVGDVVSLDGAPTRVMSVSHDETTTTSVVEVSP